MKGLLLRYPSPGWALDAFARVVPGAHVLCFGQSGHALEAEDAGFEVRDAIEVVGPQRHRVWLLRRPLTEKNVVGQVLKTGTGALWIDGCRVRSRAEKPGGKIRSYRVFNDGEKDHAEMVPPPDPHPGGRWPPNLLLVHGSGCERVGHRQVRSGVATEPAPKPLRRSVFSDSATLGRIYTYAGKDGQETIDAWACEPSCPVAALDAQSGERRSTLTGRATAPGENPAKARPAALWGSGLKGGIGQVYADNGGASRFFPQFTDEEELDTWLLRLIFGPEDSPT